jgi:hypothetical protein
VERLGNDATGPGGSRAVSAWSRVLVASCLGAVILTAVPEARAEYAVGMEPGRIALRHAAWDAADRCTPLFPRELGDSVELTITLGRRGRVLSIAAEPDVPAFRRCVLRALRRHLVPATGEDRRAPRWVVVTRYVFARPSP